MATWTATSDVAAGSTASGTDRNQMVGTAGNLQFLYDNRVVKITENVLGAPAASVTFSSIPGTFRHLFIVWQARGDLALAATLLACQLNGDTAGNYDGEQLAINGTTVAGAESLAATSVALGALTGATGPASCAGGGVIWFPNYAGTTFQKVGTGQSTWKEGTSTGTIKQRMDALHWRSASAVTSVKLFPASGNFITGSSFQIYGAN